MASSKKRPPADLSVTLADFLTRHVPPGQHLVLGLSGGLDSCVLLSLLAAARDRHPFQLQALHVHHGLSPNADAWADFCAGQCEALQVPFQVVRVQVPRDSGLGIEAAARAARYAALAAADADAVVLAHHRDDQAETLLLQLLRGAGVKGLAAMAAASEPASTPGVRPKSLLRPLLETPRAQLLAYAETRHLRWIDDESNLDLAYDRNFVRHAVFPLLERRFPAGCTTLARAAGHLAEAAALLDEVAVADAAGRLAGDRLTLAGMAGWSAPRRNNLLRYWLAGRLGEAPSARSLAELSRQLWLAGDEAQVSVPLAGARVHRYRGQAWLVRERPALTPASLVWQGQPAWEAPAGTLVFEAVTGRGLARSLMEGASLTLRARDGGERFKPDARRPTRTLRHWCQSLGIPAWQRDSLPLLYVGDTLAWVDGIGAACQLKAGAGEPGIEISWQPALA